MSGLNRMLGLCAVAIVAAFALASPANAQATRTWISGVGDDVNPCSRTAPCKTFAGAISKTAAGGEIDTLDPGGFGAVTVTKAITLANEGIGEAGILVAGTNGITVNCTTDPNCTVILRGLQLDGGPVGSNSLAGVRFFAGKNLIIENCMIRNFTGGSPNGYGVNFSPSSGVANLVIRDTTITNNGQFGFSGAGVFIQPTGTPAVSASLTNVQISNNNAGVRADSSGMSGGSITVSVTNGDVSNNANGGVAAISLATVPTTIVVDRTSITNNAVGINANGPMATLRIGNSKLAFNPIGYKSQNGGTLTSFGTNEISDNPANTGTLGTTPPQ